MINGRRSHGVSLSYWRARAFAFIGGRLPAVASGPLRAFNAGDEIIGFDRFQRGGGKGTDQPCSIERADSWIGPYRVDLFFEDGQDVSRIAKARWKNSLDGPVGGQRALQESD